MILLLLNVFGYKTEIRRPRKLPRVGVNVYLNYLWDILKSLKDSQRVPKT